MMTRFMIYAFFVSCLLNCELVKAQSASEAIESVQPKVVKIFGAGGLKNLANYGTGILVSPDGHIATVWNHLLDSDAVAVVLNDGRRFYGRVIGTDSQKDIAILKIDAEELPFFDIGSSVQVGPGTPILAFSNVFKVATGDEPVTVMQGVVSAKTELAARRGRYKVPYDGEVYLVDAVTNNPGAAGGVLTTMDGRLLGMLGRELKGNNNTWLNYAIPFPVLKQSIEDIIAGRFSRRDDLLAAGGEPSESDYQSIDFGFVLVPDVVARTPAFLDKVIEKSKAEEFGLRPDDLIVFANGELVQSIRTFNEILDQLIPGDDLQLIVRRGDDLITVQFVVPRK
ncbi:S1C family serine protease [Thalassoglobus polymorphus]|uniref:Serine protease HhoB n=1 Tax=Thalassoglobus polymorphus TaxID=2527994 RepID=A0A517QTY5_9PLAN|nr:trypsin-like peptidase domain-containing protein [Thalassoglobus polymorphus]QDT35038.1 Putative serine protease HhoB precursor [Thalassoglobus polymorphus]